MKAAVLESARDIVCREVPVPTPRPNELLVRVSYCGVCGSDVPRYLEGKVHGLPLILGHEFSGRIESVGQECDSSLIGKRVAGIPLVPCMKCDDCVNGNYALCKNYSFIGSRQPGAYAEYVCVPSQNVHLVSDQVSDLQAAFFEPASVAQHAINLAGVTREFCDLTAMVAGCGTIGIFIAQILQALGLRVVALARNEKRIAAARAAGLKEICDTSHSGWGQDLLAGLPKGGFDFVFDTSGNNELMIWSLKLAANRATVCYVGTPKKPMEISVSEWENINRKELLVTGSWMSYSSPWPGEEWSQVESGFAAGTLNVVDEMIDAIYGLGEIASGLERFSSESNDKVTGKVLIDCRV